MCNSNPAILVMDDRDFESLDVKQTKSPLVEAEHRVDLSLFCNRIQLPGKPLRSLLFSGLLNPRCSTLGATAAIRERSINARQVLRVGDCKKSVRASEKEEKGKRLGYGTHNAAILGVTYMSSTNIPNKAFGSSSASSVAATSSSVISSNPQRSRPSPLRADFRDGRGPSKRRRMARWTSLQCIGSVRFNTRLPIKKRKLQKSYPLTPLMA